MGTGYVRQSSADIVAGNTVEAGPLNAEFNQVQSAFDASSGHSHDGTTGEGPKIGLTTGVSGVLPVANGGVAGIHNVAGTTAPTANEDSGDGYAVGSMWLDTTNDRAYICVDSTATAAVWVYVGNTTGWQPLDATLTALAGVTTAADKLIYATGSDTFTTTDLTSFARTLLDDASASAVRTTLGLVIGTDVQAYDADLAALAAISGVQGDIIYHNGTAWVRLAAGTSGHFLQTSGAGANPLWASAAVSDAELLAIAGLTSAADKLPYFTGSGTASLADFTAFARTILDDATAADVRTTLGLVIGTNVQAYDAELAAIAGLTSAADKGIYFTGSGTATTFDLTSFARTLLDDANVTAFLTTLGITSTVTELNYTDGVTSAIQTQLDAKAASTVGQGQHTIWVPAGAMTPRTTNGPAASTFETTTNDVMLKYLAFDATTKEGAQFGIQMPKSWDEGPVVAQFVWTHPATATNFGVSWELAGVAFADDDAADTAFGTLQEIDDTGGTTYDIYISDETPAITIAGTPGAEEYVIFQVTRDPADAGDTMAVDAWLLGVKIHYTTNDDTDD